MHGIQQLPVTISWVCELAERFCWSGLGPADCSGLAHTFVISSCVRLKLAGLKWLQLEWLISTPQDVSSSSRLAWNCSHSSGRFQERAEAHAWGLGLESEHHYFNYIIVAKASQKAGPDSRNVETDSSSWWEELQSHIARGRETGGTELRPCLKSQTINHHLKQRVFQPQNFKSHLCGLKWKERVIIHQSIRPHPQIWIISVFNSEDHCLLANDRSREGWKEACWKCVHITWDPDSYSNTTWWISPGNQTQLYWVKRIRKAIVTDVSNNSTKHQLLRLKPKQTYNILTDSRLPPLSSLGGGKIGHCIQRSYHYLWIWMWLKWQIWENFF